jgi:hypothetical protein
MNGAEQVKRFVSRQRPAFQTMAKPVGATCESVISILAARCR